MRRYPILCLLLIALYPAHAAKKLKVLFVGNSYTYVNNMPQTVADIAAAMGDTLVWDMEAPGGMLLLEHFLGGNPATMTKIQVGNWDYVVLQEQSLVAAMPDDLADNLFVYAKKLDSVINLYNPCAETMFYMTWGRKNGHPDFCNIYSNSSYNWPHFCTYSAMDSMIRLRYQMVADSNRAVVAPVGAVWHYIRNNYPAIELYNADESHPSAAGSYAAACCFYAALYKKDPTLITYNGGINSTDAADIREAVKKIAYDSMLLWHLDQYRTEARFTHTLNANTASFTNTSANASDQTWHFGDGETSAMSNPVHTYNVPGNYNAILVAVNSTTGCHDTAYAMLNINTSAIPVTETVNSQFRLFPNPARQFIQISSSLFLSGSYLISILNASGQTIRQYKSRPSSQQLVDLSSCANGLYFLMITREGQTIYRSKFVVQK